VPRALEAVRGGECPELTTREKHLRECYVVLKDGADADRVEKEIKNMPNYFADYDTTVHFISKEEFDANHKELNHGGFVFRSGSTGKDHAHKHVIEFSLKLDSNPEFTTSVIICYARAIKRLADQGQYGCKTVFDIPPVLLSEMTPEEMRSHLL
jgi:diaminopimelate dehydrogenase